MSDSEDEDTGKLRERVALAIRYFCTDPNFSSLTAGEVVSIISNLFISCLDKYVDNIKARAEILEQIREQLVGLDVKRKLEGKAKIKSLIKKGNKCIRKKKTF